MVVSFLSSGLLLCVSPEHGACLILSREGRGLVFHSALSLPALIVVLVANHS